MSPAWFLVGVVFFYLQVVGGAARSQTYNEDFYYCPSEFNVESSIAYSGIECQGDSDCEENQMCCTVIVVDNAISNTEVGHYSHCTTPQLQTGYGFCPKFTIQNTGFSSQNSCNTKKDCDNGDLCCLDGNGIGTKSCTTPQSKPPIKYNGETCSGVTIKAGLFTGCTTDFGCTDKLICCGFECNDPNFSNDDNKSSSSSSSSSDDDD